MTTNSHCKALLFDLDGTMIDTAPDIVAAVNRMLDEFGAAPLPFDTVTSFIGNGVRNLVRRSLAAAGLDERVGIDRAQPVFERHYAATNGQLGRVFPGVMTGLRELRQHGYRAACVTNKPQALAAPLLEKSGLAAYLDVLIAGDTLASMKPSPQPLWHACRLLDVDPQRCALVGDSSVDIAAARAAGLPVFIVSYGYGWRGGNRESGALQGDALIDSFEALPALLARRPLTANHA
ncbi:MULTISPECIES: phosphoglycolate phosphatase [Burkholderiaceae]|uniref:phosphoglycolate phosphatase n=1 Tax=Burkholderiaceae TaxID=119060 RepID=UPI0014248FBB|nr:MULTISPECIES: phosphoglycolate phosphatase [Burkholderiaceae]MBN3849124.1 phosphoglycolate phosphatase [Paraburkholderia sp. Ac-20342]NIF51938.1 phosphoglycolate phosphatase [Burkholderia sp. Ax-1724]